MATDQNDEGRRPDPSDASWKRESEAQVVEDKLAWLISTATPEEPRYTPPSDEERESALVLSQVETDVLVDASSTLHSSPQRMGAALRWMVIPGLLALVVLLIAVLVFAMSRRDGQSVAPAVPAAPAAPEPAAGAGADPVPVEPKPTESTEEPRPAPESTTTTDCVLPASTVQVAIVNDREEPSAFMPGLMLQVWDVNFTNDTTEAVVVGVHFTSTRDDKIITEDWTKRRVSPGRTEYESGSRDLTVNGKQAEQASFIIDRLVVVENRDACVPLLDDPKVQAQAVELPVPPSP